MAFGVPSDVERLKDTVAPVDQILLQRPVAERIPNGVFPAIPRGTYRINQVFVTLPEELGVHPVECGPNVGKVAGYGGGRRILHGAEVVRAFPGRHLDGVAGLADCRTDVVDGPSGFETETQPGPDAGDGDGRRKVAS